MTTPTPKLHEIKCWKQFYPFVASGLKTFEIRLNDRNYQVGDKLLIREFDEKNLCFTGARQERRITYLTEFSQKPGFVVLGLDNPALERELARVTAEKDQLKDWYENAWKAAEAHYVSGEATMKVLDGVLAERDRLAAEKAALEYERGKWKDRAAELERERDGLQRAYDELDKCTPVSTNRTRNEALAMLGPVSRHVDGPDHASHGCVEVKTAQTAVDTLIGDRDSLKAQLAEALAQIERLRSALIGPYNYGDDRLFAVSYVLALARTIRNNNEASAILASDDPDAFWEGLAICENMSREARAALANSPEHSL